MGTMKVEYLGNMQTACTHDASGVRVLTDPARAKGGQETGFAPTDLCAAALATCMMTIMGRTAQTHQINVTGMRATAEMRMAEPPKRIGSIRVDVYLPGGLGEKERALLERAANLCPVHASLHPDIAQEMVFHYGG